MEQEDELVGLQKIKGCSQKYGNKKGVTSGSSNYFGKVGSYVKR